MPLYEYVCDICKGITEKVQPVIGEPPLCCGSPMRKLPTSIAMFKMKGMGGYPSLRKARQKGGADLQKDDSKRKVWV